MGMSGGGGTTTVTQQAPQLLPQGEPGYNMAQTYYQGILENPPIYEGPRVPPVNPTQEEYMSQGSQSFGTRQPTQVAAENEVISTASGSYLPYASTFGNEIGEPEKATAGRASAGQASAMTPTAGRAGGVSSINPNIAEVAAPKAAYTPYKEWTMPTDEEIQKFVTSAQEPYLRRLERETLPQVNADFGLSGTGVNNTREQANKQAAIDRTSELIASDVVAPIYNQMKSLEQDFINAENQRRAAIATGDADRIMEASKASAQIKGQLEAVRGEVEARMAIANAELETQASIEGARLGTDVSKFNVATEADLSKFNVGTEADLSKFNVGTKLERDIQAQKLNQLGFSQERSQMLAAAGLAPELLRNEALRVSMLGAIGDYEANLNQQNINAQMEAFQEPIIMQSGAANALFGASGMGPGSASSVVQPQTNAGDVISTIGQVAMIAALGASKLCWIADAIYGVGSRDASYARLYVNLFWTGPVANVVRFFYKRYGRQVAWYVERSPFLKKVFKPIFDIAVRRGKHYVKGVVYGIQTYK